MFLQHHYDQFLIAEIEVDHAASLVYLVDLLVNHPVGAKIMSGSWVVDVLLNAFDMLLPYAIDGDHDGFDLDPNDAVGAVYYNLGQLINQAAGKEVAQSARTALTAKDHSMLVEGTQQFPAKQIVSIIKQLLSAFPSPRTALGAWDCMRRLVRLPCGACQSYRYIKVCATCYIVQPICHLLLCSFPSLLSASQSGTTESVHLFGMLSMQL